MLSEGDKGSQANEANHKFNEIGSLLRKEMIDSK